MSAPALDPILEAARWPERDSETWQDDDREADRPGLGRLGALQFRDAPSPPASGGAPEGPPPERPAEQAPMRFIRAGRPKHSKLAVGLTVGLLLLGGYCGGYFYGVKMSAAVPSLLDSATAPANLSAATAPQNPGTLYLSRVLGDVFSARQNPQ